MMAYRNSGGAAAAGAREFKSAVVHKQAGIYIYVTILIELAFLFGMLGSVTSAPAEDLITSLPEQPEVTFKQYGGYVTVDAERQRALYYYFVEAEADADTKPLTLWLNGGPGCSSLGGGAFTELGPFFVGGRGLIRNFNAWNRVSNVLFLETPAGVGFSYSNTSSDYELSSDSRSAQDSLTFLLEWFKKFPEYEGREFFIAGQSYAGHYAPQLASAIVENNARPGQVRIELKGIAVGNPGLDLIFDTISARITFLWSHGLVSETTHREIFTLCRLDGTNESNACALALNNSIAESGVGLVAPFPPGIVPPVDAYDVLVDICTQPTTVNQSLGNNGYETVSPCIEQEANIYLNRPEVQAALHARLTNWSACSPVISTIYNLTDQLASVLPVWEDNVQRGLRSWIFCGDQDAVIPFTGTRQLVGQMVNKLNLTSVAPYRAWFQGQQAGGWSTSWGNLTFATVRGAGHSIPLGQPARALQLFTSFISGTSLPSTPQA